MNFAFIWSNIQAAPVYGVYNSQLIRYSRACGSYQDFLDRVLLLTKNLLNQGYLFVKWSHYLESFAVATMTWLIVMEYLCHKWPRICSTSRSFPHSWLITGFVVILTRRVPLVENLSSPPVFSEVRVTRFLVLCVCFVDRCLSLRPFSFGHCVVCPSSIYGFWLPPFGFFKPFLQ